MLIVWNHLNTLQINAMFKAKLRHFITVCIVRLAIKHLIANNQACSRAHKWLTRVDVHRGTLVQ